MEMHPYSINRPKFKQFLDHLRTKYPFDDMLLVMDNLGVHRSNDVKERLNELGFKFSYTPAYSPAYNGIEEVWSMAKRKIRNERLNKIINGERIEMKSLILNAFDQIKI